MADSPNLSEISTTTLRNRDAKGANNMARNNNLPRYPKATPGVKAKEKKVFDEAKAGKLHAGSKDGPIVTKQSQKVAIALSEGRKYAKEHGRRKEAGPVNSLEIYPGTTPQGAGERGVEGLLAGSGGPTKAETSRPYGDQVQKDHWDRGQPHSYRPAMSSHGYGHDVSRRSGSLRMSGHSGAHRLGSRSK